MRPTIQAVPLCDKNKGDASEMDGRTLVVYITAGGATERYAHIVEDAAKLSEPA